MLGLGEVNVNDFWIMRGQFGPAGEVQNDWNKFNYVTDEGELLQGTAFIKEGLIERHGKFLEPGVFLQREHGGYEDVRSFEGCYNQGKNSGLCHLVRQDGQQNVTSEHTGYFGGTLGRPDGFGVYKNNVTQLTYIGFFKDGYPSGFGYIRDPALSHHFTL